VTAHSATIRGRRGGPGCVVLFAPGSTETDAVTALLSGPTAAERNRGLRTYVPAGTKLNSVSVVNGLARVDLSLRFALGKDAQSLDARLAQLVHTVSGVEGATSVQLLVNGGTVYGMFPGIVTSRPITLKYLETPNVPASHPAPQPPSAPVTGPLAGEQYGVALPKGSRLTSSADAALSTLIADGTVQRLQKKWLSANLSRLPVLR
jgi:ABC-type amino acid transport substrate-binding protein